MIIGQLKFIPVPYRTPDTINIKDAATEQLIKVYDQIIDINSNNEKGRRIRNLLNDWQSIRKYWIHPDNNFSPETKPFILRCEELLSFIKQLESNRAMFGKEECQITIPFKWGDSISTRQFSSNSIIHERISFLHNYAALVARFLYSEDISRKDRIAYAQKAFNAFNLIKQEEDMIPLNEKMFYTDHSVHSYALSVLIYSSVYGKINKFIEGADGIQASQELMYGSILLLNIATPLSKWPKIYGALAQENSLRLGIAAHDLYIKSNKSLKEGEILYLEKKLLGMLGELKKYLNGQEKIDIGSHEKILKSKVASYPKSVNPIECKIDQAQVLNYGQLFEDATIHFKLPRLDTQFTSEAFNTYSELIMTTAMNALKVCNVQNQIDLSYLSDNKIDELNIVESKFNCDVPTELVTKMEEYKNANGREYLIHTLARIRRKHIRYVDKKRRCRESANALPESETKQQVIIKINQFETELNDRDAIHNQISEFMAQTDRYLKIFENSTEELRSWMMHNSMLQVSPNCLTKIRDLLNYIRKVIKQRVDYCVEISNPKMFIIELYNRNKSIITSQESFNGIVENQLKQFIPNLETNQCFITVPIKQQSIEILRQYCKVYSDNVTEMASRKIRIIERTLFEVENIKNELNMSVAKYFDGSFKLNIYTIIRQLRRLAHPN